MSIRRIYAILRQEFYITHRAFETIIDILVFPLINIVIFGFLSLYLIQSSRSQTGHYILIGMILWQIIWTVSYTIPLGSLWNIWSRNLSNLFIAPITTQEYIFAHTLSGIIKAGFILFIGSVLSDVVFHFNILSIGIIPILLVFINFAFFAFSCGIAIVGFILRYGTRIQALAWGVIPAVQPLSAAFFPLNVLPQPLQYVAYLLPPTFSFEAARFSLVHHSVNWQLFGLSFGENIIYCILFILFFKHMFKISRDTGQFARNEN